MSTWACARVKRIKQGQYRVDPVYDGQGWTPRLGVVVERTDQYRAFVRGPFRPEKYKQQAVAILFTESLRGADLRAMFGFPRSQRHAGVRADEIFVYLADFERVAEWEVHDLVADCELEDFTASLAMGDKFWCIQRFAGPPIVFVHTDEQARTIRASALPVTWADTYFEIAKRHDEFGYLIQVSRPWQCALSPRSESPGALALCRATPPHMVLSCC